MGSFTDNMKQIPTPFAICMNMKLPNVLKQKERFTMKSHWTTQQADGNPVAKYMPALWKRYKNFQVGLEMYDQGKVQTLCNSVCGCKEMMNSISNTLDNF